MVAEGGSEHNKGCSRQIHMPGSERKAVEMVTMQLACARWPGARGPGLVGCVFTFSS